MKELGFARNFADFGDINLYEQYIAGVILTPPFFPVYSVKELAFA